jgi:hypothetical protein
MEPGQGWLGATGHAIGVLQPAAQDRPEHLRSDWGPAGQWRGSDRYDHQRIHQLFPTLTRT